jgi:hypothetical protein
LAAVYPYQAAAPDAQDEFFNAERHQKFIRPGFSITA